MRGDRLLRLSVVLAACASPCMAALVHVSGHDSASPQSGGPRIEEVDGGIMLTVEQAGLIVTLVAIGGVIDADEDGLGVSPVDDAAGSADISGEEAIIITFSEQVRWESAYLERVGPTAPGPPPPCPDLLYSAAAGTFDEDRCLLGAVSPPLSAGAVLLSVPGEHFVRISGGGAGAFRLSQIQATALGSEDPSRGIANLSMSVSGDELRFGGGGAPTPARIDIENLGPDTATNLRIQINCNGCEVSTSNASAGTTYDALTNEWSIPSLPRLNRSDLNLSVRALPNSGATATLAAVVTALDQFNSQENQETLVMEIVRPGDDEQQPNDVAGIASVFGNCSTAPLAVLTLALGFTACRRGSAQARRDA